MNELNSTEIEERYARAADAPFAIYFYTPMCGTCGIAEKMLSVIEAASPKLPLYKCNINFAPTLAQAWQITSVPCLALITEEAQVHKLYAMRSVPDLYTALEPLMNKET